MTRNPQFLPLTCTALTLVILLTALLLPSAALAWFYSKDHLLGQILSYLETTPFRFDRDFHVVIFAWLVPCLKWLRPRLHPWQIAVALAALATVGELIQIPIPGRSASLEDFTYDMIGVGSGLVALWANRWIASLRSR